MAPDPYTWGKTDELTLLTVIIAVLAYLGVVRGALSEELIRLKDESTRDGGELKDIRVRGEVERRNHRIGQLNWELIGLVLTDIPLVVSSVLLVIDLLWHDLWRGAPNSDVLVLALWAFGIGCMFLVILYATVFYFTMRENWEAVWVGLSLASVLLWLVWVTARAEHWVPMFTVLASIAAVLTGAIAAWRHGLIPRAAHGLAEATKSILPKKHSEEATTVPDQKDDPGK
jgi:hypothetical protein